MRGIELEVYNIYLSILKKEPLDLTTENIYELRAKLLAVSKMLSKNTVYLPKVASIFEYLFYIEPINYYYLLYSYIPKSYNKNIKVEIEKEEKDPLYDKISYVLDWSPRELKIQKYILDKVIDRKEWLRKLGIK